MIIIKLPIRPISVNQLYRVSKSGHIYKIKAAKDWCELAQKFIREQFSDPIIESNIAITLKICLTGNKIPDLDNCLKLCIDALQGIVIKNDNQIVGMSCYRKMNCDADQITISITDIDY